MNLGGNLKKLRHEANFTQAEIAERLGLKQSSYVLWEQKESNPTLELLSKLSKTYHCSIEEILGTKIELNDKFIEKYSLLDVGQKEMIDQFIDFLLSKKSVDDARNIQLVKANKKASAPIDLKTYKRSQLHYAIVDDEQLSAGFGKTVTNTGAKYKAYTASSLKRYDGAARISGDSMEPEFLNFSIVTFMSTGFDRDGGIYAISEGDPGEEQLYIKQVFREEDGFRIHSLNPKYKDFYLGEDNNFRVIGPVVDHFEELDEELIEED